MEVPIYMFDSRDSFFGIGSATICPHVLDIMVSVVISKLVITGSMSLYY